MASTAAGTAAEEPDEQASDPAGAPFDAVANLRLLGEVQRRGLEAANLVIARLTERTNAAKDATAGSNGSTGSTGSDPMTAMTEAFVSSMSAAVAAMAPDAVSGMGSSSRGPAASAVPEVVAASGAAGETVEVDVWLHNYTDELAAGIELHAIGLVSASGALLSADCITTRPQHPVDLSAESSRAVQLRVDLPADTPAGRYRGVVAASHLADLWLVLEVDVRATDAD